MRAGCKGTPPAALDFCRPHHPGFLTSIPPLAITRQLQPTTTTNTTTHQHRHHDRSRNEGEARAALAHVRRLVAAGLSPGDIGIITPYSAQVALIKELRPEALSAALEVSTVDGFQV